MTMGCRLVVPTPQSVHGVMLSVPTFQAQTPPPQSILNPLGWRGRQSSTG